MEAKARGMEARAVGARAGKEIGAKAKEIAEREEKDGVAKGTEEKAKEVSRDRDRLREMLGEKEETRARA